MQFRIFNNTQTVTIDDKIVNRINRYNDIPLNTRGIEFELELFGVTAETNTPIHIINNTIEKALLEDLEIYENADELGKKADEFIRQHYGENG